MLLSKVNNQPRLSNLIGRIGSKPAASRGWEGFAEFGCSGKMAAQAAPN